MSIQTKNPIRLFLLILIIVLASCNKPVAERPAQPVKPTPAVNQDGAALLHAAGTDNIDMAKELLDQGVDVNFRGSANNTPLMEAAYAGHVAMAKFLLDHGADISAKKNDGETPLTFSVGHKEVAELLKNVSDLVEAAGKGDNKTLIALVEKGTPVNAVDQYGHTALSESCWNGHTETVKLLLAKSASPTVKKPDGETPLTLAAARKHPDIVVLLNEAIAKASTKR
jgi:uncharacterized protein